MAHLDLMTEEDTITVRHNVVLDKVIIRVGYFGSVVLQDKDEVHALIDQLQDAVRAQAAHQGRELLRDENTVRTDAEIREALQ